MEDRPVTRVAGPALLGLLFAGLFVWSFRKWADVHIDFGNELYVAWRLAEGDALYRDIAHRWYFTFLGTTRRRARAGAHHTAGKCGRLYALPSHSKL